MRNKVRGKGWTRDKASIMVRDRGKKRIRRNNWIEIGEEGIRQ